MSTQGKLLQLHKQLQPHQLQQPLMHPVISNAPTSSRKCMPGMYDAAAQSTALQESLQGPAGSQRAAYSCAAGIPASLYCYILCTAPEGQSIRSAAVSWQ
jgi:hypothetical protein